MLLDAALHYNCSSALGMLIHLMWYKHLKAPVDFVADIVSGDVAATLKVLYTLFNKHKGKLEKRDT